LNLFTGEIITRFSSLDRHQSPEIAKYFEISNHTPDYFVIVGTENGKCVYIKLIWTGLKPGLLT
jgi:hypothetical protein